MLPSSRASGGGGSKSQLKKSLDDVLENSFHISTIGPAPEGCSPEQLRIHQNRRIKHMAEAEESMVYICRTLHKYLTGGISPLLLREFYQSYLIREGQSKCAEKFVQMMRLQEPPESPEVLLQIGDAQLNYEAILQILSAQDATAMVEVQTAIEKINDSKVSLIKKQQRKREYFNDDSFLRWFFYFYIQYPGFASKVDRWNHDAWHVKWAKTGYGYTGVMQKPLSEIDYTFTGPKCDTSHVLDFDPDFLNEMVCVFTIVWRLWLSEHDHSTDASYIKILRENIPSRPWNKFFNESFVPTSGNRTRTEPIDPAHVQEFFQELLGQCSEEMQDPRKLQQWIGVLTVVGNKIADHTESVRKCVIKHVWNASGSIYGWGANAVNAIGNAIGIRTSAQDFGRFGSAVASAMSDSARYGLNAASEAWNRPRSRPSEQRFIEMPEEEHHSGANAELVVAGPSNTMDDSSASGGGGELSLYQQPPNVFNGINARERLWREAPLPNMNIKNLDKGGFKMPKIRTRKPTPTPPPPPQNMYPKEKLDDIYGKEELDDFDDMEFGGSSKTRKRRHNKKTHRTKPRKLMSRRQKYSRRK